MNVVMEDWSMQCEARCPFGALWIDCVGKLCDSLLRTSLTG